MTTFQISQQRIENQKTLQESIIAALANSKSQNELAKKLNVSPATVVNIKTGKWDNLSDEMVNRLLARFKIDAEWKIRSTANFTAIQKFCQDARENKRFMAVCGYTGAGKTTALKYFAKNNNQCYYLLANSLMTRKSFIYELQTALGIKEGVNVKEMMDAIVDKLNSMAYPLLIIDDAGKLGPSIFPLIQIIYDATEYSTGLIISGTEYLEEIIKKGVRFNRLGFRELHRRISYVLPMSLPSEKIVAEICGVHGIEDPHAIRYIFQNTTNYGDIRNLITNAKKASQSQGVPVSRELMEGLHVGKQFFNLGKAS